MKRKQFMLAALVIAVSALGMVACKKQASNSTSADVNQIEQLAKKFTQPIDASYPAVAAQYSNLTEPDLTAFWLEVNKINRNKPILAPDEQAAIVSWVADNNKKSTASFGIPFNKLTPAQFKEVFLKEMGKQQPDLNIVRPPDPPPTGCSQYSYPLFFNPISSGVISPAANSTFDVIDIAASVNDPYYPCSGIEYWYSGTQWNSMIAITPLGAQCIGWNGGWSWLVRKDNGFTKVFAPKTFIIGWFGSFANFNNNVRVAYPYLVES